MTRTSLKETYSFGYGIFVQVQPVLVLVLNRFPFFKFREKKLGMGDRVLSKNSRFESGKWNLDQRLLFLFQ